MINRIENYYTELVLARVELDKCQVTYLNDPTEVLLEHITQLEKEYRKLLENSPANIKKGKVV